MTSRAWEVEELKRIYEETLGREQTMPASPEGDSIPEGGSEHESMGAIDSNDDEHLQRIVGDTDVDEDGDEDVDEAADEDQDVMEEGGPRHAVMEEGGPRWVQGGADSAIVGEEAPPVVSNDELNVDIGAIIEELARRRVAEDAALEELERRRVAEQGLPVITPTPYYLCDTYCLFDRRV